MLNDRNGRILLEDLKMAQVLFELRCIMAEPRRSGWHFVVPFPWGYGHRASMVHSVTQLMRTGSVLRVNIDFLLNNLSRAFVGFTQFFVGMKATLSS